MSPPRPAVLVLLLVLLVVIVLFVVGLGVGSQQRRGTSEAEISSLKERVPLFGGAPRVRWPPPGPRCSGALPAGPCTLDIPRGKALLRKVTVTTNRPMSIDFAPASTPDRTVTLDIKKDFSKPAELSVDYKGGRLILNCLAPLGSTCNVTVM